MANAGWLFFKGYFEKEGQDSFIWKAETEKDKERNQEFLKTKNKNLFGVGLSPVATVNSLTPYSMNTTYPGLLIGSGLAHETGDLGELKIGFSFDHTTGMPIIPGSSIKGAIRGVFPQFDKNSKQPWTIDYESEMGEKLQKSDDIINKKNSFEIKRAKAARLAWYLGLEEEEDKIIAITKDSDTSRAVYAKIHEIECLLFDGMDIEACKSSIASGEPKTTYFSIYRRDIFHDAFPTELNKKKKLLDPDSITPHIDIKGKLTHEQAMLRNPIPLPFVKVASGVKFDFYFDCKAPDLGDMPTRIKVSNRVAFYACLICDFGLGAKTNVGYGSFVDPNRTPIVPNTGIAQAGTGVSVPPHTQVPQVTTLPIDKIKKDKDIFGRVVKIDGRNIDFELMVDGYGKKATASYGQSDKFKVGQIYLLRISSVEGKGANLTIRIVVTSPDHVG